MKVVRWHWFFERLYISTERHKFSLGDPYCLIICTTEMLNVVYNKRANLKKKRAREQEGVLAWLQYKEYNFIQSWRNSPCSSCYALSFPPFLPFSPVQRSPRLILVVRRLYRTIACLFLSLCLPQSLRLTRALTISITRAFSSLLSLLNYARGKEAEKHSLVCYRARLWLRIRRARKRNKEEMFAMAYTNPTMRGEQVVEAREQIPRDYRLPGPVGQVDTPETYLLVLLLHQYHTTTFVLPRFSSLVHSFRLILFLHVLTILLLALVWYDTSNS